MAYSGNSPAKDQVRFWAYEGGNELKKNLYHIVIASQECGDIKYLLSKGVRANRIIACDLDPIAVANADQMGVIVSPHGDIAVTTNWAIQTWGAERIATVNVDLCMTLPKGVKILRKVLQAFNKHYMPNYHEVFFTYLRGRDNMNAHSEREAYLARHIDWPAGDSMPYQSRTDTSRGSPMCAVAF